MPLPEHLIVSTDFDGTLTAPDSPDLLCPGFMEWIRAARETTRVTWVINTGRCWPSLQAGLQRRQAALWPDWVVLIEREIHRVQDRQPLPLQPWNDRCTASHARLFQDTAGLWSAMRRDFPRYHRLQLVEDVGCPLGLIADSEAQADLLEPEVNKLLEAYPDLILVRNSVYFRFGQVDFTKGSCLREIAAQENVTPASCYAAGDHYNDLSMLNQSAAAYLCCPSNAANRVKKQVRLENGWVSEQSYSEGVLDGLNYYFA